ncbi:GPI biosynthesis protein family Pig-F-domain-containing protein [Poronia punctata]|nr:GPI biosynthesis protein family Pig-F-domain-containing protein [Poronia punctata]
MSSSTVSPAPEKTTQQTPTQAVRTNPSPEAQALRHAHHVLLLGLLALRFRALVADPVSTMWSSLPAVFAIQAAYTIICLPAVGTTHTHHNHGKKPRKKKTTEGVASGSPNFAVTSLVALILSTISGGIIHIVLVLFGAPFLTHFWQTFLCSEHVAFLGLYPLFYTRGVSGKDWLEILSARAPFDEGFGGLVGAGLGAWLGAVPIPLDWDREWQKWPVTILCGVYAGYSVGKLIGGSVAFGRRFADGEEVP